MAHQKFNIIKSTCIPIQIDNCNTDLIIPARYLASTSRDPKFFGDAFMRDLRFNAKGEPIADFVLNQPAFCEAPHEGCHEIIVGGQNWGSGSCFVLPVIVSEAFQQELFASIAKDADTVVTVDLPNQTVTNEATGHCEKFDINGYKKYCLMNGYDDIDYLLSQTGKIEAFENKK